MPLPPEYKAKGHPPYNNGEGGRPKRYTEEYVNQLADDLDKWILLDKENIFIEEWCFDNNIPEASVSDVLVKFEKFSKAYAKLKSKQKFCLYKGGLKRKYAHPMCALILSANHDINLKSEQKLSGDVENPLAFCISTIDGNTKDLVDE